jgi:hypothetical protein
MRMAKSEVIHPVEYVSLSKEEASEVIALLSLAIARHTIAGIARGTPPEIVIFGNHSNCVVRRIVLGVDIIPENE